MHNLSCEDEFDVVQRPGGTRKWRFCFPSYLDRYLKRRLPRPLCMREVCYVKLPSLVWKILWTIRKKMDKLRLWSNKNKNDFPSNCRINTYLINLVWLISLKGRNRAYRTGWTNLQRALWWKNAWRTHGMNLLHCIEKCYSLLIILYFISSITSVRFLSACFYFFVSLVWSSSDQVIKVKWCCFYWKAQWKPYNYWSLAGIFA